MKYRKLPSLVCLLLATLVSTAAIYLGFTAAKRPARLLLEEEGARAVAAQLVECLSGGDFQQARDFLYGSPSLVLPQQAGEDAAALLWNHYRESLSGELVGEPYLTAQGYYQDAVFRGADLDGLTRRMKELAPGLAAEEIESAEDPSQVYNEDLTFREDFIAGLLLDAAQKAMGAAPRTRECRVRLRLCYGDGRWAVQPDQALLDILAGMMENV